MTDGPRYIELGDVTLSPSGRLLGTRASGGNYAVASCNDCGSLVVSGAFFTDAHDRFHEKHRPPRKASFIVARLDGSFDVQFIDGTFIHLEADTVSNFPRPREELLKEAVDLLNGTNKALAPFYEGGAEVPIVVDHTNLPEIMKGGEAREDHA